MHAISEREIVAHERSAFLQGERKSKQWIRELSFHVVNKKKKDDETSFILTLSL